MVWKSAIAIILGLALATGCGAPATEQTRSNPVSLNEVVVVIRSTPGLTYDGQSPGPTIKVPLGATVKLTLLNPDAVQHDWMVVEADEGAPYLTPAIEGARTKILATDEQQTITFVANRSGTFKYVCTVPGHDALMYGSFVVESPVGERKP